MLVPGSGAFDPRDNRHIEDLFLISIPVKNGEGRTERDDNTQAIIDADGLATIKTAIESFVKAVDRYTS
jgi:hypothetical protein